MPQFTVIIPTRNRDLYLAEAVASVCAQTCKNLELLIINDGTTLISAFTDPRITVLDNHQRGPVTARNLGISRAQGQCIAFLDDDDTWIDTNFLDDAANLLASQAALVFGDGVMQFPGEQKPRHFSYDANAITLEADNTILISAVCYHSKLHAKLGVFDESLPYYWDWDWYLRIARSGHTLARIAHPVVDIRIHPANMSGASNTRARTENLEKFAAKHALGKLTLKNHATFAQ